MKSHQVSWYTSTSTLVCDGVRRLVVVSFLSYSSTFLAVLWIFRRVGWSHFESWRLRPQSNRTWMIFIHQPFGYLVPFTWQLSFFMIDSRILSNSILNFWWDCLIKRHCNPLWPELASKRSQWIWDQNNGTKPENWTPKQPSTLKYLNQLKPISSIFHMLSTCSFQPFVLFLIPKLGGKLSNLRTSCNGQAEVADDDRRGLQTLQVKGDDRKRCRHQWNFRGEKMETSWNNLKNLWKIDFIQFFYLEIMTQVKPHDMGPYLGIANQTNSSHLSMAGWSYPFKGALAIIFSGCSHCLASKSRKSFGQTQENQRHTPLVFRNRLQLTWLCSVLRSLRRPCSQARSFGIFAENRKGNDCLVRRVSRSLMKRGYIILIFHVESIS